MRCMIHLLALLGTLLGVLLLGTPAMAGQLFTQQEIVAAIRRFVPSYPAAQFPEPQCTVRSPFGALAKKVRQADLRASLYPDDGEPAPVSHVYWLTYRAEPADGDGVAGGQADVVHIITIPLFYGSPIGVQIQRLHPIPTWGKWGNDVAVAFGITSWEETAGPWAFIGRDSLNRSRVAFFKVRPA